MKRSELKEVIKAEITSILLEEMTDEEREDKLQQAKRGGGKEKPLRKLAAIGKKADSLKEEEGFQMTYKGDPAHIKVQGFGGNEEGAKDTVLFVNVGGIGKRESKASKNALEKRLGLLDKKVDKIMFTDKDNISKEIKDISKSDFKIKSVLSEESTTLDKVKAEIAKHLEMYKDAEGDEAKKLAINMLKKLNTEKKRLEAERDEAAEKEMEAALSIGADQELDYDSED